MLVAFNKLDLPAAARGLAGVPARARRREGLDVVAIAAATGEGLDDVPCPRRRAAALGRGAGRAAGAGRRRRPPHRGDGRRLLGRARRGRRVPRPRQRIERIAAQTNFDVEESAERFQRDLRRLGIDAELRRAGVAAGRPRAHRRDRARVGARALGGAVTEGGRAGRWASSAARSTRSTSAHLAVAEAARDALGLDASLFIPAGEPPHKPGRRDQPGGGPPGDGRAGRSPTTRASRSSRSSRAGRAVVHGRHARGAGERASRGRDADSR